MREFLFKGFQDFFEGKQIINIDGEEVIGKWIEGDVRRGCYISENGSGPFWHVVPETTSEFTGKRDRKGKKIFEHHICRFFCDDDSGSMDYVVRWDGDKSGFITEVVNEQFDEVEILDEFFAERCEVIGDIFDTRVTNEKRFKD